MKSRSFGFVAAPSTATRATRAADLTTSEGLIEHSLRHGEMATMAAAAEQAMSRRDGKKLTTTVVETSDGKRVVVRADELERERNRPVPRHVINARVANEAFLRDTNPNHQQPSAEPIKRIDVIKRQNERRSKP